MTLSLTHLLTVIDFSYIITFCFEEYVFIPNLKEIRQLVNTSCGKV